MTRVLFIENHDSFSYNLVHCLRTLCTEVLILDHKTSPDLTQISHLVLGPGPGTPQSSGLLMNWLKAGIGAQIPILGICLGHQAIGEYFGATLCRATRPVHGEAHRIHHNSQRLFAEIPNPTEATRYHSLVLENPPDSLIIDAKTEDNEIMAVSHRALPIFGIQFHPESFLSTHGEQLLSNFLTLV